MEISNTSFPPPCRAVTSCAVNLAMETDFTRCVNSRLGAAEKKNQAVIMEG